jgi:lipopolysaccharide transport system permease protein
VLTYSGSPKEMLLSFYLNRHLIWILTKREVSGRYRESLFGVAWSFFNPILMLIIYTFFFSVILNTKWTGSEDSKLSFAFILFAGLIVFNLFSECVNRAPNLILSNVNYVKKVVFPLEILVWVVLFTSLFHAAISMLVWLVAYSILFGSIQKTVINLPLFFLPLCFFTAGLSWLIASLGVYFRDISQIVGLAVSGLMFLSPIFYPVSALPDNFQKLMLFNPLAILIEGVRNSLLWGKDFDVGILVISWLFSILFAFFGFYWFQRTRNGFSDVV